MQIQAEPRSYTPEEYLELEAQADYKSEYRDGKIVPMTGGTTDHNEITLNLAAALKFALRGRAYKVYIGDVKLWIPRYRLYAYPDVMVIKGDPIYAEPGTTTVMNPMLIVEVLSKSTRNYDLGEKFQAYRSVPDLQEYCVVDQSQYSAIQHSKTDSGQWLLTEYEAQASVLKFSSVAFQIPFNDLYAGVSFTEQR
ncbi:hypothetical protein C1752_00886 [Acaryochloris thomasi RCC1774]|uniref:Putative restriction endonuclease domain-containing protein n=1 Tax=Acaryochloris thomasi RCC1774 TaxID=1764569 RepID=A0A2W1JNC3_9CYAN|nr:Uma2 family endonuclease [Acaryochloris thomasi]PZD74789.1 hypothetical protein C1752_00886 [Acaryochloris thomasi RCC1774]